MITSDTIYGGGPTYIDTDARLRCRQCKKVVFSTLKAAQERAGEITREREPMVAYESHCGWYHLARKKGDS